MKEKLHDVVVWPTDAMWSRAAHEVGVTSDARLLWLVENFAEYGFANDPETVAVQAIYFLVQQGAAILQMNAPPQLSADTLQRLAREVTDGLDNLLEGKDWNVRTNGPIQRSLWHRSWPSHSRGRKVDETVHELRNRFEIVGTKLAAALPTIFQLAAQDLVFTSEPWRIGRCAWPQCRRRFVRHDQRQAYCSTACSQALRTIRYRKAKRQPKDSPPD
jgi:hypothetical protein